MPESGDQDLCATLQAIERMYAEKLPERLRELGDCLQRCLDEPGEPAHCEPLLAKLHGLSGSAGTFGFSELGLRATELEILLGDFTAGTGASGKDFLAVAARVKEFLHWAETNPKGDSRVAPAASTANKDDRQQPVYLVHDNAGMAHEIAVQLQHFGYPVTIISDLAQLEAAIAKCAPAAVVMDLGFPAGILAGAAEVARIRQHGGRHFALIFISTRSNFASRLATVRAGADGYFSKPLDIVALVERLDRLLAREEARPYRILLIDENAQTAADHASILRAAGMEARVLDKAAETLHVLVEYRPELILMDLYLSTCSGIELARLIRQDNMYLDVPIVFLSGEANVDKQLDAIGSGADDFLTMPITPAHLVSALSSRAQRYRELRGLIMRDGLTGLLNHSAFKENLVREVARARRSGTPLALAMLDLDHFKRVNDNYGHPVGDQVIRAVARLLQQRLRRGDIIGRYGGEEFAVIMPATPSAVAALVLDQIRESFSHIRHHSELEDFTATFSAGVAGLDAEGDADALLETADAALYRAKDGGRNRIAS
ncbi:MAG TPA: diguanylate cyclase [Noviherbaspirillum sp.]|uniref:GGDEF domain-containing response regulator n=1 Tax=Noviherbaspirillum sp. TaxID=1926288 RepID=UPI002B4830B1|nr:diguanylate cyclase [Noviherbaspirillum sp.]HJV87659.1 diguanylate cyclase [Noviherbaspirillum sp.]